MLKGQITKQQNKFLSSTPRKKYLPLFLALLFFLLLGLIFFIFYFHDLTPPL